MIYHRDHTFIVCPQCFHCHDPDYHPIPKKRTYIFFNCGSCGEKLTVCTVKEIVYYAMITE